MNEQERRELLEFYRQKILEYLKLKEESLYPARIEKVIVTKTESGYEYKIIEGDSEKISIDLRELTKSEEVKQEAMQSEARHSSQA